MTGQLHLEDLREGQRFVSASRTLTAEEIMAFARDYDPQPFHTDAAAAVGTFFGGLVASGWHTAAVTMRLLTESLPFAGGLIGAGGELSWPCPTRPDDSLHVETIVEKVTPSRSRPDRGMASLRIETRNQRGEVAQRFHVNVIAFRRPAP